MPLYSPAGTGGDMLASNNLSDLTNTTTARTNLSVQPTASPTFTGTLTSSGPEAITDTTQSTSTATGALKVSGGAGIIKDLFLGGNIVLTATGWTIGNGTASGQFGCGRMNAVAANATVNILCPRGVVVYGDDSNGGAAIVLYDGGATPVIVGQTGTNFSLSDPGAGGSKWYITGNPTNGRLVNRYASALNISYFVYGTTTITIV